MCKPRYFFFLLFTFFTASTAAYTDVPELPDGPVSPFVKPLIKAINSGDSEQVIAFIEQHFTTEYRDRYPISAHVKGFMNAHENLGELSFHAVRVFDGRPMPENSMAVVLKTAKQNIWFGAIIEVTEIEATEVEVTAIAESEEAHYKIAQLNLVPARQPSNVPLSKVISSEQAMIELETYVALLTNMEFFSGTVMLAKQDKVLYQSAKGLASKRFNVPNNMQTKFNIGSMNKMFTAVATLQLVQEGKLSLDDKLNKFIDESWLSETVSKKITIRHLLTHSSGLGSYFGKTYRESSKNNFRTLADYQPLIDQNEVFFEPGTDNRYSNTGMLLLGVVIEAVSGQDYFSYIRENIYNVADMKNSGSFELDQPVPNLAIGYHRDPSAQTGWRNNYYSHILKGSPAGGGFSTTDDMHKFALALTRYELLNKSLTEAALSAKPDLHSPRYGYGFGIRGTEDSPIVGHEGGFRGLNANLDIYLDQGYISVVLSNYSGGAWRVFEKIRELLARVDDAS